jgi:hypothetical protein
VDEVPRRLPPLLVARLNKVIDAGDAAGLALAKSLARTMELDPKKLEPAGRVDASRPSPVDPGGTRSFGGAGGAGQRRQARRRLHARGSLARRLRRLRQPHGRGAAKCRNREAPDQP